MLLWGWGILVILTHQLSCDHNLGPVDSHIESLLQLIDYDSTSFSSVTSPTTTRIMPYIVSANLSTSHTVQLGGLVKFHCRVNNLVNEAKVSWLRLQDSRLLLLSVGTEVYTADSRLSVVFFPPNDWQLHVLNARDRDQGLYQCQVSSHPPVVHTVYLQVVAPKLRITDERGLPVNTKYYNTDSLIQLTCVISQLTRTTYPVTWTRGSTALNRYTARGGISVKTMVKQDESESQLFVANAQPGDSGNYSCRLADIASAFVSINVLDGESPAAVQHGASINVSSSLGLSVSSLLLFCYR